MLEEGIYASLQGPYSFSVVDGEASIYNHEWNRLLKIHKMRTRLSVSKETKDTVRMLLPTHLIVWSKE